MTKQMKSPRNAGSGNVTLGQGQEGITLQNHPLEWWVLSH